MKELLLSRCLLCWLCAFLGLSNTLPDYQEMEKDWILENGYNNDGLQLIIITTVHATMIGWTSCHVGKDYKCHSHSSDRTLRDGELFNVASYNFSQVCLAHHTDIEVHIRFHHNPPFYSVHVGTFFQRTYVLWNGCEVICFQDVE